MSSFKNQILQEINASRRAVTNQGLQHSFSLPSANPKFVNPSLTSISSKYDLNSTNSASRAAFLRSYTNQITSLIMNDENSENLLTQLEKIPSIDLTADESQPAKKSKGKKLQIMLPDPKVNFENRIRTCTSIGEERPKVLLTSLSGRANTGSHLLYKRSTTKQSQRGESMSKISELSQDKNWRITTQKSISKLPMNVRETRINKILQEVQGRMNNEADENPKKFCINLQVMKVDSENMNESARAREPKVRIVENLYQVPKAVDISKKLNDYRNMFNSQLEDLHKAKSHLHLKNKSLMFRKKDEQTNKLEVNKRDQTKNEHIKRRFAQTIKTILRKLAHMNLTIDEIISDNVFPSRPYEREGSKLFLDTVKNGDYSEIKRLLIMNPYFVYDFDSLKQTALHWAAKRGFSKIVNLLLETGADYDARDLSGRTPLFVAAKGGHVNCVKFLLLFGADPIVKSGAGKRAIDYTANPDIRYVLNKAFKIHVRFSSCSYRKFKQNWNLLDKRDFEVKKDELEEN